MVHIVNILGISMIVALVAMTEGGFAEECVPVGGYCGNISPCCPVEKIIDGKVKSVEGICELFTSNRCKAIDDVANLGEVIEANKLALKVVWDPSKYAFLRTTMPEGY